MKMTTSKNNAMRAAMIKGASNVRKGGKAPKDSKVDSSSKGKGKDGIC